jgi:hypothetical protein
VDLVVVVVAEAQVVEALAELAVAQVVVVLQDKEMLAVLVQLADLLVQEAAEVLVLVVQAAVFMQVVQVVQVPPHLSQDHL